jgi:hypothetical protein
MGWVRKASQLSSMFNLSKDFVLQENRANADANSRPDASIGQGTSPSCFMRGLFKAAQVTAAAWSIIGHAALPA